GPAAERIARCRAAAVRSNSIRRYASERRHCRRATGRRPSMDYRKHFRVKPGMRVRLAKIDPGFTDDHKSRDSAEPQIQKQVKRMTRLQYLLYADAGQSLLIVLQGIDAAGKDGV